jgi:hypothetical protein
MGIMVETYGITTIAKGGGKPGQLQNYDNE